MYTKIQIESMSDVDFLAAYEDLILEAEDGCSESERLLRSLEKREGYELHIRIERNSYEDKLFEGDLARCWLALEKLKDWNIATVRLPLRGDNLLRVAMCETRRGKLIESKRKTLVICKTGSNPFPDVDNSADLERAGRESEEALFDGQ